MKKQFVTYEIAKKLNELGFDEECFGYYAKQHDDSYHLCIYQQEDEHSKDRLEAPLWQQAIEWLRENHKIEIHPKKLYTEDGLRWQARIDVYNSPGISYNDSIMKEFLSYDDTREQAILKAIELISIWQKK